MKTYEEVISEVKQIGYEYAETIEEWYKEDGLPLNEMNHTELFDHFTAGGDAFPEQAWAWTGLYEWVNNDGTILYLDENGDIQTIILDEFPADSWDAIYICGVSSMGYTKHQNYIHNVHIALIPAPGRRDHWEFENWVMDIENGYFEYVPSEKEIPAKYLTLPEHFWTCRMFRWAVWHYRKQIGDC